MPDLANLHLGMALARSGDKAGATAALNAVTGPRADIAKYWLLYVQQPRPDPAHGAGASAHAGALFATPSRALQLSRFGMVKQLPS